MPRAQVEKKVADYLRKSQALEDQWQRPITAEQLQAEMDRMAANTKQPEVLRELFEALGSDPFVIAECLARPIAAERLLARLDANEKIDAESKQSWLAHAETKTPITTAEARKLTYSSGSSQSVSWLHGRHMDSNEPYQRPVCPSWPHSSVDWQ